MKVSVPLEFLSIYLYNYSEVLHQTWYWLIYEVSFHLEIVYNRSIWNCIYLISMILRFAESYFCDQMMKSILIGFEEISI